MRLLFEHIKAQINANVPEFKTVEPWNGQFTHSNPEQPRDQDTFNYPACFIEFISNEVFPLSFGVKNVDMTIRFILGFHDYKKNNLDNYDLIDKLDFYLHDFRGNTGDTVQFSSLRETNTIQDIEHNNVESPILAYDTVYRRLSGFKRLGSLVVDPVDSDVTGSKL